MKRKNKFHESGEDEEKNILKRKENGKEEEKERIWETQEKKKESW